MPNGARGTAEGVVNGYPEGSVPPKELARLYAIDAILFSRTFFKATFRQPSPVFHRELFATLDDPRNRQVGIEVFRDGAKTTLLRAFTAKRISYGSSRTIMYNSASQAHSIRSLRWLRRQIEYNNYWTQFYSLERGSKWTDEHLEIFHRVLGIPINVIAVGITGQIRGVNIDDYRPDLIVNDDIDNEETTATVEQRKKTEDRFFGAICNTLAPASENAEAKNVVLATSLHKEDLINKCHDDPTWTTHKYGILDEDGRSRWEARWPTEQVKADKAAHIVRGQILLWLREKECVVGDEETAHFKRSWLRFWELLPERMIVIVSCDPAPPPSDRQISMGLRDKDEEVWSAVGLFKGNRYLLEQIASKDHDPEWSFATFFSLCARWKPLKVVIETVAYQRTLKALLERKMQEAKTYYLIEGFPPPHRSKDQRRKMHRILQAFSGIASQGAFFVHPGQQEFISQFAAYPNVKHDDRLDSAAIALEALEDLTAADEYGEFDLPGEETKEIAWERAAP